MFDDLDSLELFGFVFIFLLAVIGGMFIGTTIGKPEEMKDNNCIIYDREIYCKVSNDND